jgi:hypothetical protein
MSVTPGTPQWSSVRLDTCRRPVVFDNLYTFKVWFACMHTVLYFKVLTDVIMYMDVG